MKVLLVLICLVFSIALSALCQNNTNHWETGVYDSATWRYFNGNVDPGNSWMNSAFDDESWPTGKGGFGYADGDDETTIDNARSIFIRKKFQIIDKSKITGAILNVDYDDGFVAYLNGTEIARANMSSPTPAYNDFSTTIHEALLYQGLTPETFSLGEGILDLLVEGENTLAVEVHNADANSSDLTIRPFLSFGISDTTTFYYNTPSWFTAPAAFESSDLPIFIIETNGQAIADEPDIVASLGIIDNGAGNRNNITDVVNGYHGNIRIEVKGESSQMFPKKSFKLKTVNSSGADSTVSLLGLPEEDSWILYAPYTDKTMMRDVLCYALANKMGRYASRTRFCEVVINGDYRGVYVLMEKIKRDKNRVDISKLTATDLEGDDLTGGYILRVDKVDFNDFPAWQSIPTPMLPNENIISFQFFDPDGEDLAEVQKQYIQKYILDFQSSLTASGFKDASAGYKKFIDIGSFVDFMLVNEVSKNVDAYIFSTYMFKDKDSKGGKLKMGPVWDFNLGFGNVDYNQNAQYAPGWMYDEGYRMFWFRRMMQDQVFADKFSCRWSELRENVLSTNAIHQWIDSTAAALSESQARNYVRWPILGTYIWPNQFVGNTYQSEIDFLKQWITSRLAWMDSNIPLTSCEPVTGTENAFEEVTVSPNPSTSGFNFKTVSASSQTELKIYSSTGQQLYRTVFSGTAYYWNGEFTNGNPANAGIYYYRISASGTVTTGKLLKQ